jgi:hypothetical protein
MNEKELTNYLHEQSLFFNALYDGRRLETDIDLFTRLAGMYRKHSFHMQKHIRLIKLVVFK